RNQSRLANSASVSALWGWIRTQPLMPQASRTRPSSTASAGRADATRATLMAVHSCQGSGGFGGRLLDQAGHGVRRGGAHAGPVGQAVLGNAQGFFAALGQRVVEA